jgi:hypothetical protein
MPREREGTACAGAARATRHGRTARRTQQVGRTGVGRSRALVGRPHRARARVAARGRGRAHQATAMPGCAAGRGEPPRRGATDAARGGAKTKARPRAGLGHATTERAPGSRHARPRRAPRTRRPPWVSRGPRWSRWLPWASSRPR